MSLAATGFLKSFFRLQRTFWPYTRSHWRLMLVGMGGLLGGAALRLLEPWPLKFVIDRITGRSGDQVRLSVPHIDQWTTDTLLLVAAITLVLIATLRALTAYASTIGFALAGNRAFTAIREALFLHLQTLSLRFHGKRRSGDMVVRMISDVATVQEVVITAVLPLLGSVLVLVGMFVVMFWLDPQLAMIVFAALPVLVLATLWKGRHIRSAASETRKQEGALAATAAETLAAIKTVQTLSLGQQFAAAFSKHGRANLSEGVRVKRLSATLERSVDVLIAIATALVLWFGARRVMSGILSPGELLVFLFYLKGAFRPLKDLAKYGARLAKASAAGDRIVELFQTRAEVTDQPGAHPLPAVRGELRFEQLGFCYEPGHPVLTQIDLSIKAGTHVAVVGPSGSGKSTLAALLLRLYDPDAGRVCIDGIDLRTVTLSSLRSQVSTVLQDSTLFAGSVRDNIALGAAGVSDSDIEAAARLANAHDFIVALPQGYDTTIGERGANLSAGQRQRIAIARAALRQSPVLLLDEPTTGLDAENEALVLQALMRLAAGRTTLHITHRLEAARDADRILVLQSGRIAEDGTHTTLMAANGLYARLQRAGTGATEAADVAVV